MVAFHTLQKEQKTYSVRRITDSLDLSDTGDYKPWENANILTDFSYPWEAGPSPTMSFKALHNERWLYFFFQIRDPHVSVFRQRDHKLEVVNSSRAEIFFRIDEKLSPYYCLEIDSVGRVLDYKATYHRTFDFDWSWPEGHLLVNAERHDNGYAIQAAISKSSLEKLGLLKNDRLQAGLFRGDCFPKKNASPDFKWISWLTPDSESPDFHIPSAFGILTLEDP